MRISFEVLAKVVVALLIVSVPSGFVYSINRDWGSVKLMWLLIGLMVGGFVLLQSAIWLLRAALIFLGMSPESLDREYGSYYYGPRRRR